MAKSYQDTSRQIREMKKKMPPMGWYFFVIYFQLFITAISSFYTAYIYLTKKYLTVQGVDPAVFYGNYRGFRFLDITFGLINLVVGVAALYVRFRMKALKKDSWRQYLKVILLGLFQTVFYMAGRAIIMLANGVTISSTEFAYYIPQIIGGIGIYFISDTYFGHRDYLFVN